MTRVREFHEAFGQDAPASPPLRLDPDAVRLRMRLIREEYQEVMAELTLLTRPTDPRELAPALRRLLKELADLRYVVEGTAVVFGLPIDAAFAEVHSSNMSKLGADGKPITRADGKVLKGPGYRPADMAQFVPDITEIPTEEYEVLP